MRLRTTLGSAAAATALVVAGMAAVPAITHQDVQPAALTSPEESAAAETLAQQAPALPPQAVEVALNLAQALQRDLGIDTGQFLAQANTAAALGNQASDWKKQFAAAFGGVWLDDAGHGVVGVAPAATAGQDAARLRSAATAAGFTPQDVALSEGELQSRLSQVQTLVNGLPADQREIVKEVRADRTRGEIVVATDGGTEAQLGNITAALHGLAKLQTTNAPQPEHDTAPFGSLGPGGNAATKDNKDGTATLGGVAPTGSAAPGAPAATSPSGMPDQAQPAQSQPAQAGTAPADQSAPPAPAPNNQVPTGPGGAGASLQQLLDPDTFETLMNLLGSATGSLEAAGISTGSLGQLGRAAQADPAPKPAEEPSSAKVQQPRGNDEVVGGTAYDSQLQAGKLECSTGFNGTLDGQPVVITAAHCNRNDGVRAKLTDGTEFGTFAETKTSGLDSALIKVDQQYAGRFDNNLVGADGGQQPITGTARPVAGQVACKMGSRTGFSCGKISETGATIDVAGQRTINNAFTIDLCALPGDSGGVVFAGDKALGISSASNVAGEADCGAAARNTAAAGLAPSLSVVPIDDVLAAHPGLRLNTA